MVSGYIVADGYDILRNDAAHGGAADDEALRYDIKLFSELMKRLGVAECMQWRLRRRPLGVEDWRKIAGEDTGSMFEVCACLGTRSEQLRRFGHLLGVLYHGCDDVGDVRGAQALGGGGEEDVRDGILDAAGCARDPRSRNQQAVLQSRPDARTIWRRWRRRSRRSCPRPKRIWIRSRKKRRSRRARSRAILIRCLRWWITRGSCRGGSR